VFPAARNDYSIFLRAKQRGIALLVMLALILVAFTTIAISRLSINSGEQKARARTTQALIQSRDAIMAFTLSPAIPNTTPPGTLPCPDGNADGLADQLNAAGRCPQQRGLVPFRTLGIPQPLDGTHSPIWYVVANEYSRALVAPTTRNSSSATALRLTNLPMAFILLAPNKPLRTQVRANQLNPIAAQAPQFLEDDNSDNTLDSYTNIRDDSDYDDAEDTQNDQVLAMPMGEFWSLVEGVVLREVGDRLREYRDAGCGYPWAAPIANNNNSGMASCFEGRLPLTNWNASCGSAAPDAWITTHWNNLLYYAICRGPGANPPNPPINPCLELDGDGDNNDAEAIVISPGIEIATRANPPTLPSLFELENDNTTSLNDNRFLKIKPVNHSGTFNDLIHIVR
jgi:hypothetical protein